MFLLAAVACTKTDDLETDCALVKNHAVMTRSEESENVAEVISDSTESEIELSEPLDNPYSVVTMQAAYNSLPAATRSLVPNLTITATHRYVKIPVISENILDALSEIAKRDNLEFSDYPMDRDVINGGIPNEQEGVARFLYASLPVTYSLPDTINYELIDNLYIPDENLDSEEEPTTRAGEKLLPEDFIIALVNKAMVMTNNEDYCYVPNTDPQTRSWRPAGRIEVWDDVKNGLIPLQGAKVRCRRWFTYHRGITDANGYFSCDGRYKRPGNYSIVWERAYWDIRSGFIGQALYNGPKKKGNWNLQITGGKSLRYATIHRACYRWWYGDNGGLHRPDFSRSIKIMYSHKEGRANYNGGIFAGIIRDIRIFGKNKWGWRSTDAIFSTAAHELGHAMHSKHISRWDFWHTSHFIRESFAVFAEYVITKKEYEALGLFEKIEIDDTSDSHLIGWYYPQGKPAWGSKKLPLYRCGQYPDDLNQNTWNLLLDPDDARRYSPIFIDLMDRKNQRTHYSFTKDPTIYPDDDIRGMSVQDIQYIAMRVSSHKEVTAYLRDHIGKKYEEQIITEEMIQRYMEVYMRM